MKKDDRLIYLLSRAEHCLKAHMKAAFAAEGLTVTPVQTGILFLLRKKPHTMSELSRTLTIDNSAITGLVDRLERAGFALRRPNPEDRRAYVIHLTDAGAEEIERARKIVNRVNAEIQEGFSEAEIETFKRVLNGFFDKFNGKRAPGGKPGGRKGP